MKRIMVAACLLVAGSQAAFAEESYIARINDDGKDCARVKVVGVNGVPMSRTKCRTLDQWEAMGYEVNRAPEALEAFRDQL